jgi:hypothetical protein
MLLISGIASAQVEENIIISPPNSPIQVIVNVPLDQYPPLNVTYINWTTNGTSTYDIRVIHDDSGAVICRTNGTITSDPQIIPVTNGTGNCTITNSDNHTIYAQGYCPQGECQNINRSKNLTIGTAISPIPEITTLALVGAGMIGLIGIRRWYKK